jgi:hypothetical protein
MVLRQGSLGDADVSNLQLEKLSSCPQLRLVVAPFESLFFAVPFSAMAWLIVQRSAYGRSPPTARVLGQQEPGGREGVAAARRERAARRTASVLEQRSSAPCSGERNAPRWTLLTKHAP